MHLFVALFQSTKNSIYNHYYMKMTQHTSYFLLNIDNIAEARKHHKKYRRCEYLPLNWIPFHCINEIAQSIENDSSLIIECNWSIISIVFWAVKSIYNKVTQRCGYDPMFSFVIVRMISSFSLPEWKDILCNWNTEHNKQIWSEIDEIVSSSKHNRKLKTKQINRIFSQ